MSKLRVRSTAPSKKGQVLNITPENAGWKYVGFSVFQLKSGKKYTHEPSSRETCVVVLSGKVRATLGEVDCGEIGERESVFDDVPPHCVYISAHDTCSLEAVTDVEIALCSAPGRRELKSRIIGPSEISIDKRGEGTNYRIVRNILPETEEAESLLIAEVITPGGHWSSYPPHKHDMDRVPEESALEETYYHRLSPPQGFAFQRVYTDDRSIDETMSVEDGDTVLVPRGYHPVGASHGYDLYYLNVMAGPKRTWIIKNDPAHEWIVKKSS